MREFFKGWRRKAGCGLLVMAVLVCSVWLRSLIETDVMEVRKSKYLISGNGGVHWTIQTSGIRSRLFAYTWYGDLMGPFAGEQGEQNPGFQLPFSWKCHWRMRFAGVESGYHEANDIGFRWWRVSYWSIVLPFTLLSAYLILWKPRKAK
jgi:hypothetical protein